MASDWSAVAADVLGGGREGEGVGNMAQSGGDERLAISAGIPEGGGELEPLELDVHMDAGDEWGDIAAEPSIAPAPAPDQVDLDELEQELDLSRFAPLRVRRGRPNALLQAALAGVPQEAGVPSDPASAPPSTLVPRASSPVGAPSSAASLVTVVPPRSVHDTRVASPAAGRFASPSFAGMAAPHPLNSQLVAASALARGAADEHEGDSEVLAFVFAESVWGRRFS